MLFSHSDFSYSCVHLSFESVFSGLPKSDAKSHRSKILRFFFFFCEKSVFSIDVEPDHIHIASMEVCVCDLIGHFPYLIAMKTDNILHTNRHM